MEGLKMESRTYAGQAYYTIDQLEEMGYDISKLKRRFDYFYNIVPKGTIKIFCDNNQCKVYYSEAIACYINKWYSNEELDKIRNIRLLMEQNILSPSMTDPIKDWYTLTDAAKQLGYTKNGLLYRLVTYPQFYDKYVIRFDKFRYVNYLLFKDWDRLEQEISDIKTGICYVEN